MNSYKKNFIKFMIESGVLTFGEFVTKSGRQTPYFINTGNYNTGMQASKLGDFYSKCIMENIENGNIDESVNVLFGPAYKGIPLAVSTAIALATTHEKEMSYCFNRKEVKDHGEGGKLVGKKMDENDKVLITEDVITAGTAIRECFPILEKANVEIGGLVISVDRMEKGTGELTAIEEINRDFGIKTFAIVNVKEIRDYLKEEKIVDEKIIDAMEEYMKKYCVFNVK